MATIDLGKIKMVWRGTYAGGTAYVPDDVVEYTDTAITSTYICTAASTGNAPSSGGTAHASWAYMAKGAQGTPTTTRGDVIYRGASADARLPKGTTGHYLRQGTNDPYWDSAAAGFASIQTFGAGSHTYTKPSGITLIRVTCTAGGASGAGGDNTNTDFGGGGGAGGTSIEVIDATSINTVSVTVGAGGAAVSGNNNGNAGGASSFGSYCSAVGGGVGRHGNAGYIVGGNGGGSSGGNINLTGGAGGGGSDGSNMHLSGGAGGASYWGGGGLGEAGNNIGTGAVVNAGNHGSGGGGANAANTSGAGGGGIVLVEEFK